MAAMKPVEKNIINDPLVNQKHVILPPLYIKLGLMKQFIKALNRSGECFEYICSAFPGLSYEKKKAGIFDWPQPSDQNIAQEPTFRHYNDCR